MQRALQLIAPLLLGSLAGVIHPHLGAYFTEPKIKHIFFGIILGGASIPTICSPITSMKTVRKLGETLLTPQEKKKIEELAIWEQRLERVQSLQLLNPRIFSSRIKMAVHFLEQSNLTCVWKNVAKRVLVIVLPFFILMDCVAHAGLFAFSFFVSSLEWIGNASPAYLESVFHPFSLCGHLLQLFLSIFSIPAVCLVYLLAPENGIEMGERVGRGMLSIFNRFAQREAAKQIASLKEGDLLLLPIVVNKSEVDALLPAFNAHMTYLLLDRNQKGFNVELVERGYRHRRSTGLDQKEMTELVQEVLDLRYIPEPISYFSRFKEEPHYDLGMQADGSTNCVLSNLFALLSVWRDRGGGSLKERMAFYRTFKEKALEAYGHYMGDYYPYASREKIYKTLLANKDNPI